MTGNDKDGNDLNEYQAGKDGLSQAYQQNASEMPSATTDEAILAASRKAVGSGPVRVTAPFSSTWHVPVSIAAVVVLSVLVVFNLPNESERAMFTPAIENLSEVATQEKTFDMNRNAAVSQNAAISESNVILENIISNDVSSEQVSAESSTADLPAFRVMRSITSDEETSFDEIREETAMGTQQQLPESISAINSEVDFADQVAPQMPVDTRTQLLEDSDTVTTNSLTATMGSSDIVVTAQRKSNTECTIPRPEVCAEIYMPVCAVRDTGIRCVTTPCDNTEDMNYPNACSACSDENVFSYTDGLCESTNSQMED